MRYLLSLMATALLAACAYTPPGQPGTGEPVMRCNDDRLGRFIGQTRSAELERRLRAESGARIVRWVPKGGVVTMEFRGDRLTVQLDEANRIVTARCG